MNDQKYDAFKIAKGTVKTNQDIVGETCTRNDKVYKQSTRKKKK